MAHAERGNRICQSEGKSKRGRCGVRSGAWKPKRSRAEKRKESFDFLPAFRGIKANAEEERENRQPRKVGFGLLEF